MFAAPCHKRDQVLSYIIRMSEAPLLAKTPKFEVWTVDSPIQIKKSSEKELSLSSKNIRKVIASEVALIASNSIYHVTLEISSDTSSISNTIALFDTTTLSLTNTTTDVYDLEICRATLFTTIVTILPIASQFQSSTLQYLVDLLNLSIIPAIPLSSTHAGTDVIACLYGLSGYRMYTPKGLLPAAEALKLGRLKPLTLTAVEGSILSSNNYLWVGSGCLLNAYLTHIAPTIDCTSALFCEVLGYSGESYDPLLYETHHAHRGQMNSASNLRMLLENSKKYLTSTVKKELRIMTLLESFPQVNGPALDYLTIASK